MPCTCLSFSIFFFFSIHFILISLSNAKQFFFVCMCRCFLSSIFTMTIDNISRFWLKQLIRVVWCGWVKALPIGSCIGAFGASMTWRIKKFEGCSRWWFTANLSIYLHQQAFFPSTYLLFFFFFCYFCCTNLLRLLKILLLLLTATDKMLAIIGRLCF